MQFFQKIETQYTGTVSARGAGLYFLIPANIIRCHKITAGDRIEMKLQRHYKPVPGDLVEEVEG